MIEYKTIAETNRFIVLDRYDKDLMVMESYQSEDALEREIELRRKQYAYYRDLLLSFPKKDL